MGASRGRTPSTLRKGRRRSPWGGPQRLPEGILVRLVWVYLYVYLDNARYTEGILYSLQK
jgi:hypothetical protein